MKKFLLLLMVIMLLPFTACQNAFSLDGYVSELRSDVFEGATENYTLKVAYGFKENTPLSDGKRGELIYGLTFKLVGLESSDAQYTVSIDVEGVKKKSTFALNPISHSLIAFIEVDDFTLKEFTADITVGSDTKTVTLKSILPENSINYSTALSCLYNNQTELIESYKDENDNFCAEICARVIVKNDKVYWYVGLIKDGKIKALLIDGFNGDVLAIREIM